MAPKPAHKAFIGGPTTRVGSTPTVSANVISRKRKTSEHPEDSSELSPPHRRPVKARRTQGAHATSKAGGAVVPVRPQPKKAAKPRPARAREPSLSLPLPSLNRAPTDVLSILVCGTGDFGELGLGPRRKEALRPRLNPYLNPQDAGSLHIVQVDCGGMHVVALTNDNKIVTWGVNDKGALGRDTTWECKPRDVKSDGSDDGSSDDESDDLNPLESTPTQVPCGFFPPGTTFVQVAAGDSCSLALTETGLVYGWGTFLNHEGKPGFCFDSSGSLVLVQHTPRLIPGLKNITQVTCGANHALALDQDGNVWAWGAGEQGQLGRRLLERHATHGFTPHRVGLSRQKAKYIASGLYHSFAVDDRDDVWAWGLNSYNQAGFSNVADIDSVTLHGAMKIPEICGEGVTVLDGGQHHSAATTSDGRCFAWGRADGGQLGIGFSKEQLGDETLVVRDARHRPRVCLRPTEVAHIGKASSVACGTDHTVFVARDGKSYSAGFGSMGQLGLGSEDDVEVARVIGGKALEDRVVTWAGAGGQFSLVGVPG